MSLNQSSRKISFFYPSKNVGGAQVLFSRLANFLATEGEVEVSVIDHEDGYLVKNTLDEVQKVNHTEKNISNSNIITPLSKIEFYNNKFTSNNRVLYWCIHPENLIFILRGAFFLKKIRLDNKYLIISLNFIKYNSIRKILIEKIKSDDVYFMDVENKVKTLSFYNINQSDVKTKYLPIPIDTNGSIGVLEDGNLHKFVWIGRLDRDKIFSLLYVLEALNSYPSSAKISIKIIGDGDCRYKIKEASYTNLIILFTGNIPNSSLTKELLAWKPGLAFGMGTSVLETAIRGIPSIIVDPSHGKIPSKYCPLWLYETNDFTLGSYSRVSENSSNNKEFEEMLSNYFNKKYDYSARCYNYVKDNHSLDVTLSIIKEWMKNES